MPIKLKALRDLDRTTGPTPKGTVFEVEDSEASGVEILIKAGYVERVTDVPTKPVKDA